MSWLKLRQKVIILHRYLFRLFRLVFVLTGYNWISVLLPTGSILPYLAKFYLYPAKIKAILVKIGWELKESDHRKNIIREMINAHPELSKAQNLLKISRMTQTCWNIENTLFDYYLIKIYHCGAEVLINLKKHV